MIAKVSPNPFESGRIEQEAPALPSRTTADKGKRKAIKSTLTYLIRQQVGSHADIRFTKKIKMQNVGSYGGRFADERTAAGMYYPAERLIEIALADKRYPDFTRTALHEPFHAVQDLLATPAELKILKREEGRLRKIAARELNLSPEQAKNIDSIEVQAAAYDAWGRNKLRGGEGLSPPITRLYQRIKDFLQRAANALHGLGFRNANDVFESTFNGEMTTRESPDLGRFAQETITGKSAFPAVVPAICRSTQMRGSAP